jgi:hypothetical protein
MIHVLETVARLSRFGCDMQDFYFSVNHFSVASSRNSAQVWNIEWKSSLAQTSNLPLSRRLRRWASSSSIHYWMDVAVTGRSNYAEDLPVFNGRRPGTSAFFAGSLPISRSSIGLCQRLKSWQTCMA